MATDPAPSFVAVAEAAMLVGRSSESAVRLADPTVSPRHATVRKVDGGYLVEDHDSSHGTFVNGTRVRVARARPGDRIRFGSTTGYRVESHGLRLEEGGQGLGLVAHGLTLAAPVVTFLGRPGAVDILVRDVSFRIAPGQFVGILGPSGAGKSTVLNCLAGYSPPRAGALTFGDRRDAFAEREGYWALIGHVPQDDVVFRPLTVRENLAYAARLRLGDGPGDDRIAAVVTESLERVDLLDRARKTVSELSGGQRKRLSVAVELLRRPQLLLLDEPTSGLDPASEADLMEQLKGLAQRGTTVVATTHLMDNLRLFDEVIVLGTIDEVGLLAYTGPPDAMLDAFRCRRFADLYEKLDRGKFTPIVSAQLAAPLPAPPAAYPATRHATDSVAGQVAIVGGRSVRLLARDRALAATLVVQPLFLSLLVCLTQYNVTKGPFALFFFLIVVAIWLGLNNSVRDLVRDRRLYIRERLAGLRWTAFLGARVAVHAALGVAQVAIVLLVLRTTRGLFFYEPLQLALGESSAVALGFVLWSSYLGGVGMGLLVSTLVRTEEAAVAALPLLIMPQLLISAVAAGVQNESYTKERPLRPLVLTLAGEHPSRGPAALIDFLSMPCLSRPAALVAERRVVPGYGAHAWVADLCHLIILLLATWALVVVAFQWAERRWLRLVGV